MAQTVAINVTVDKDSVRQATEDCLKEGLHDVPTSFLVEELKKRPGVSYQLMGRVETIDENENTVFMYDSTAYPKTCTLLQVVEH